MGILSSVEVSAIKDLRCNYNALLSTARKSGRRTRTGRPLTVGGRRLQSSGTLLPAASLSEVSLLR